MQHFDFSGLRIDKALRRLLAHVRVPGEAQKIERIMEVFGKRFSKCNPNFAAKLKSPDSIVTLSFAVMLLNTDLHTPNLKDEKKMKVVRTSLQLVMNSKLSQSKVFGKAVRTHTTSCPPLNQAFFFNTTWEGGRGQVLPDVEFFP